MSRTKRDHALRAACVLTLVGLALCVWSLLDPRPIPVIIALSIGQVIGTVAFGLYLAVLVVDLRLRRVLTRRG